MPATRWASCAAFGEDVFDDFLAQRQFGLLLDQSLHLLLVGALVGLGARAVHGRAFAAD